MIGRTLSHYKILEEISRGGMGIVYRARDVKLNRDVAIKVLPPDLVADPERKRRFVQEAQAAAALHHPHIAVIHEIDEVDGVTFIAMELIEGDKLGDLLQRGRLPLARSFDLAIEVAEGLARAHSKGIVHRDLKPANIMVTDEGHAKIIDFGLAKLVEPLGSGDSHMETALRGETDPGKVMGTVSYMSPEQARGGTIDERSDIFSFAVVVYEMLTGTPPFQGATGADTLSAILKESTPRLPSLGPEVSDEATAEIQRAMDKGLAKDANERYQTVKDLLVDLRSARRGLETGSVATAVTPSKTSKRMAYVALGLAALALVSAYVFQAYKSSPPEAEDAAAARKMIVVLPFENLGLPEDDYFAAGMTEEITSRLAVVSGLGVISRSSALRYEKSDKNTKEIGEALGVDYILEGTVRWNKAEGGSSRVRVTPQLIRVSDDTHVWAERYDQVLDDIFQVQSEIAEQVIRQLDIALVQREKEAIAVRPTENLEAYHAYLRGLEYDSGANRVLESTNKKVIEMLERAVQLDPQFAAAYARLSMAHALSFHYGYDRTEERLSKAKEAVDKSLELQPDLPEAHLALGYNFYWGKREYERALQELAVAEKGLPNNADVLAGIAYIRRRQGQFEESLKNLDKAIQLTPLNSDLFRNQAQTYTVLRRYTEAQRYFELAMSVTPDALSLYIRKAQMEWLRDGDPAAARATLEAMPRSDEPIAAEFRIRQAFMERNYTGMLDTLSTLPLESFVDQEWFIPRRLYEARAYRLMGERELARAAYEDARVILERELEKEPDDYRLHSSLGIAYAGLGLKQDAVREGRLQAELYPVSRDALHGPERLIDLALIYTMVGDHDAALDQIEQVLSIPAFFSVGMLQLSPDWDPLREHPRYQEIVEKYSEPSS